MAAKRTSLEIFVGRIKAAEANGRRHVSGIKKLVQTALESHPSSALQRAVIKNLGNKRQVKSIFWSRLEDSGYDPYGRVLNLQFDPTASHAEVIDKIFHEGTHAFDYARNSEFLVRVDNAIDSADGILARDLRSLAMAYTEIRANFGASSHLARGEARQSAIDLTLTHYQGFIPQDLIGKDPLKIYRAIQRNLTTKLKKAESILDDITTHYRGKDFDDFDFYER